MSVPYEKIVEEDLNLGSGTVDVTMPAGGTATGHQIGPHSFAARAFSSSLVEAQAVAATTDVLELDTEDLDTDDWFDEVSTFEFQPDVAGVYLIVGQATVEAMDGVATLYLYRGTSPIAQSSVQLVDVSGTLQVQALVTMDGDADVLTLRFSHTDADSKNVTAATLSGILLGKLDV